MASLMPPVAACEECQIYMRAIADGPVSEMRTPRIYQTLLAMGVGPFRDDGLCTYHAALYPEPEDRTR